jgi:hypothetical protein
VAHPRSGRATSITIEKLGMCACTRTTSTRSCRSIKRRHFIACIGYPELFLVILNGVIDYDDYFEAKYDCIGKIGFSSYQKCSAAVRQFAYGVPGDLIDDYMRMSESTCYEAMYRFCEDVIAVFDKYYLREPNMDDIARLLSINESREFSRMLGSIDACIGSGRTDLLVGKGSSKGIRRGAPLYWRLLPHRIFEFGTPSLAWQD